ncbi:MAG TPA: FtsQ-type POTRA domain-containing protein [Mycobacteriales bacterium]|jgi:cell division protein FtsQ|nr:FtsQ-type POTRA domain-containing protein [Mycobacteriales bacterium]
MTAPTRRRVLPAGSRQDELARLRAGQRQDRRDRLRRRVRRTSYLCVALVPVCLVFWLLLASPLLAVTRVEVTGTSRLGAEQVLQVAGIREGTPLARVDSPALRARVATLAPVAKVRVVRAWPHTLRLQVTERTALASVRVADGSWALVDVHRVRFGPSAAAPPGVPELQVPLAQAEPAVQVLAELPGWLREQVAAVQLPSPASVVLQLRSGRAVVWGPPGQAARKAAVVAALLPRPGRTVDVTAPEVAVVREAG